jgi:hypothetical protein
MYLITIDFIFDFIQVVYFSMWTLVLQRMHSGFGK